MLRLSSNLTLFLKLFLPVFWTTVLIGITAVTWFAPEHYFGGIPLRSLRWGMLFVLMTGVASFWILFWPLKRVETDGEFLYVSNYFRTARYQLTGEVKAIRQSRFFIRYCTVELMGRGAFGSSFRFIPSRKQFDDFRAAAAAAVKFE